MFTPLNENFPIIGTAHITSGEVCPVLCIHRPSDDMLLPCYQDFLYCSDQLTATRVLLLA